MSSKEEYIDKLVAAAKSILEGTKDPILGCREIVSLSLKIDSDDPIFNEISGIEDQFEEFPKGSVRSGYSKDYLDTLDRECEEFLAEMMPHIIESCQKLIEHFSDSK